MQIDQKFSVKYRAIYQYIARFNTDGIFTKALIKNSSTFK